jgi:hypothetical protein
MLIFTYLFAQSSCTDQNSLNYCAKHKIIAKKPSIYIFLGNTASDWFYAKVLILAGLSLIGRAPFAPHAEARLPSRGHLENNYTANKKRKDFESNPSNCKVIF